MGLEDFHDPVEVLVLPVLQLVPAGPDRACSWGGSQQSDLIRALSGQIDQLFLENPLDPVPAAVDGADLGHLPGGLDDPAERVVDDGRRAARLGDDHVSGHGDV